MEISTDTVNLNYTPTEEEEVLAAFVASFITKAYGSEEAAAEAIMQGLESGDMGAIQAGVIHAQDVRKKMTEKVVMRPRQAAKAVLDLI